MRLTGKLDGVSFFYTDNIETWLVLLERFAGETEVLGTPVKVEISDSVVAGSSNHKKKQEQFVTCE